MKIKYEGGLNIEDHSQSIPHWNQHYIQMEAGHYQGSTLSLFSQNFSLFRESGSVAVSQTFEYDNDFRHILIPVRNTGEYPFPSDACYQLPRASKVRSPAPSGYEMMVLSLKSMENDWLDQRDTLFKSLPLTSADYSIIYDELETMTSYVMSPSSRGNVHPLPAVKRKLLDVTTLLIDAFADSGKRYNKYYSNSRYIINACHQYVEANPQHPPTLMELCRLLRISRRTLQYSFEKEAHIKPSLYFMALRLSAVRKHIMENPWLTIAECAAQQGFFNLPYFSRCYKNLHMETAAQTQKKARELLTHSA